MLRQIVNKYFTPNKIKFIKVFVYGVVTNTAFSIFLRSTADVCQQNIENRNINSLRFYDLNFTRTKNIAIIGGVIGPLMYAFYSYLDKILPGKTFKIIAKKILFDQLLGGTLFIFIYIVGICLLEGQSLNQALNEFCTKFPFIYLVRLYFHLTVLVCRILSTYIYSESS
jgi:hypothetical protein